MLNSVIWWNIVIINLLRDITLIWSFLVFLFLFIPNPLNLLSLDLHICTNKNREDTIQCLDNCEYLKKLTVLFHSSGKWGNSNGFFLKNAQNYYRFHTFSSEWNSIPFSINTLLLYASHHIWLRETYKWCITQCDIHIVSYWSEFLCWLSCFMAQCLFRIFNTDIYLYTKRKCRFQICDDDLLIWMKKKK